MISDSLAPSRHRCFLPHRDGQYNISASQKHRPAGICGRRLANKLGHPEAAFVLTAVRGFRDPDATLPNPSGMNASEILRLATAHAVLPMVYRVLRAAKGFDDVTNQLQAGFEEISRYALA